MELDARLRAFAAVARRGSFSQAAVELYVSQPAVSKQVALLEREVGRTLVTRGARGATLTEAGRILADYVLRAEALLANGRRALESSGTAGVGTLALAASGTPGLYVLPTRDRPLPRAPSRRGDPVRARDDRGRTRARRGRTTRSSASSAGSPCRPSSRASSCSTDEIVLVGAPAARRPPVEAA